MPLYIGHFFQMLLKGMYTLRELMLIIFVIKYVLHLISIIDTQSVCVSLI